jgi:hypothetical protein
VYLFFIFLIFLFSTTSIFCNAILFPITLIPAWGWSWGIGIEFLLAQFALVILIEAFVVKKYLSWTYVQALGNVALANAVSTLVGIPLGLCLDHFMFASALDFNAAGNSLKFLAKNLHMDQAVIVYLLMLGLVIFYFYVSVFIEYAVIAGWNKTVNRAQVYTAVWYANRASYGMIVACFALLFVLLFIRS